MDIANFALTLEYLEAEFYALALDAGVLSGDALGVVENLESHESQHVDALIGLLESVGATPVEKPTFTFPADALSQPGRHTRYWPPPSSPSASALTWGQRP